MLKFLIDPELLIIICNWKNLRGRYYGSLIACLRTPKRLGFTYLSNYNIYTAISDFFERILLQPPIQVTLDFLINKQYLVMGLTAYNNDNSHGVFPDNRHV